MELSSMRTSVVEFLQMLAIISVITAGLIPIYLIGKQHLIVDSDSVVTNRLKQI